VLNFSPEPLEQLRARFPAAMQDVYSDELCQRLPNERPSLKRQHVFDYYDRGDAWRLIASTDDCPDGKRYLHVSVSASGRRPTILEAQLLLSLLYGPGTLGLARTLQTEEVTHLFLIPLGTQSSAIGAKGGNHVG
jgi:hypothetical protein